MTASDRFVRTTFFVVGSAAPSVASALVVASSASNAHKTIKQAAGSLLQIVVATSYSEARWQLSERPPQLLVTELRLDSYNGVGLVLRAQMLKANVAALVLADAVDAGMRSDVEQLGATFVVKPCAATELKAAVLRTLFRRPNAEGGLPVIRPPFERRIAAPTPATVAEGDDRRAADLRRSLAALADSGRS